MLRLIKTTLLLAGLTFMTASCGLLDVDKVVDPNSPSTAGVLEDASAGELQDLVSGLESIHRSYASTWRSMTGTMSRELYYFTVSDPTYAIDWLQLDGRNADAENSTSFFVSGSAYATPYRAVRQANLLIAATDNSTEVSDSQKNGYIGFANTIKAFQLQMPLMFQYTQGIRVDVPFDKTLDPSPFVSYDDALSEMRSMLDEGANQLKNSDINFDLSRGFDGFGDKDGLVELNRAIAARYAVYAKDWDGALSALSESFMDLTASTEAEMLAGPAHTYSGGNDSFNPHFQVPDKDESLLIVASPDFVDEAEAGDNRIDRWLSLRTSPATNAQVPNVIADYQLDKFASETTDMPFIRNEELILIYAEALINRNNGNDLNDAVDALNSVRNAAGLGDYSGNVDQDSLIDEMLTQRRYSLWAEGHYWVDMRRYDRLGDIDTSKDGGRVPEYVGRPQGELDWESYSSGN